MKKITINVPELDYNSSEAYKSLRTNLKFTGADNKVIALTSCFENEGKSTVTMNLAIALAEAGNKVIMVDADLRKSVLLGRTKVNGQVMGLTHFLSKQAALNDIVCVTNIRNFHMIYSGPTVTNPAELLGGERFSNMIEVLRGSYDYILIDTSPLGMVIDCAVVAPCCDGIIMVVESGADSYKAVRSVKEQIDKTQCPFLGVVLNKVDISKGGKYGRYYGKYGQSYGTAETGSESE